MAHQSSAPLTQKFSRIAQLAASSASMQMINQTRFKTRCFCGFDYSTLNSRAQPNAWSVLTFFEISRAIAFWKTPNHSEPTFLDFDKLDPMIYIVAFNVRFEPELYSRSLPKHPIDLESSVVQVGNTSFKINASMTLPQVLKPVVKKEAQFVFVDPDTRRPSSPPTWWSEKYSQYNQPGERRVQMTPFDFSSYKGEVMQEKFCMRISDLDAYYHVNNRSYIRFCYEAYAEWFVRQHGFSGEEDPFKCVKNLECVFRGEAGLGDILTVSFAHDPHDVNKYHFQITKDSNSSIIFQCSMQFYSQHQLSKL